MDCYNILGLDSEALYCQTQGVIKVTGISLIYFDELSVKLIIFTVFEIAWFSLKIAGQNILLSFPSFQSNVIW